MNCGFAPEGGAWKARPAWSLPRLHFLMRRARGRSHCLESCLELFLEWLRRNGVPVLGPLESRRWPRLRFRLRIGGARKLARRTGLAERSRSRVHTAGARARPRLRPGRRAAPILLRLG